MRGRRLRFPSLSFAFFRFPSLSFAAFPFFPPRQAQATAPSIRGRPGRIARPKIGGLCFTIVIRSQNACASESLDPQSPESTRRRTRARLSTRCSRRKISGSKREFRSLGGSAPKPKTAREFHKRAEIGTPGLGRRPSPSWGRPMPRPAPGLNRKRISPRQGKRGARSRAKKGKNEISVDALSCRSCLRLI